MVIQTLFRVPLADQAAGAAAVSGLEASPCGIGSRVALQNSQTNVIGVIQREPEGKAAEEIRALFRWARARLEASLTYARRTQSMPTTNPLAVAMRSTESNPRPLEPAGQPHREKGTKLAGGHLPEPVHRKLRVPTV